MSKRFASSVFILLFTSVLFIVSGIKINMIWGSSFSFLSGFNLVGPLAGIFLGLPFAILILAVKYLFKLYILSGNFLNPLLYYVPTLCAMAYWKDKSKLIRLFLPLVCMALFVIHPIGNAAWFYSLYWFIPLVIYCLPTQTIFTQSLGSTFTAHAVGTVLWLYFGSMNVELFYTLMPIVFIERLLIASGMTIMYYLLSAARSSTQRLANRVHLYLYA
ncbi:MAG: hypothetical protein WDZ41_01095 [Candidatus Babeliales bacterium]